MNFPAAKQRRTIPLAIRKSRQVYYFILENKTKQTSFSIKNQGKSFKMKTIITD